MRRTYVETFTALQLALEQAQRAERAENIRVQRERRVKLSYEARRSARRITALINTAMFVVTGVVAATLHYFDIDPSGGFITGIAEGWAFGVLPIGLFLYFKSLRQQWKDDASDCVVPPVVAGSPADVLMLSMHYTDPEMRANAVFESLLTQSQLEQWHTTRMVTVPLARGRTATIGTGRVMWSDDQNQCVGPYMSHNNWMPIGDVLLCQLLYLRNDPNYVRKVGHLLPIEHMANRRAGVTLH